MNGKTQEILGKDSGEVLANMPVSFEPGSSPWDMMLAGAPEGSDHRAAIESVRCVAGAMEDALLKSGIDSVLDDLADGAHKTRVELTKMVVMAWTDLETSKAIATASGPGAHVSALMRCAVKVEYFKHVAVLSQLAAARHLVAHLLSRISELEAELSDARMGSADPPEVKL